MVYATQREEEYFDILPFVRSSDFNDVWSEQQFKDRAARYRRETEIRKTVEQGTTLGTVIGMGLSFLDLTTLIPVVGLGSKITTAGKAVRLGAYGGV